MVLIFSHIWILLSRNIVQDLPTSKKSVFLYTVINGVFLMSKLIVLISLRFWVKLVLFKRSNFVSSKHATHLLLWIAPTIELYFLQYGGLNISDFILVRIKLIKFPNQCTLGLMILILFHQRLGNRRLLRYMAINFASKRENLERMVIFTAVSVSDD